MSNIVVKSVDYQANGQALQGRLVWQSGQDGKLPGLVMAPNWMGVSDKAVDLVRQVVAQGYVVFIADLYGADVRPTNAEEAGAAMMAVKDTPLERTRMQAALDTLVAQTDAPVDSEKLAAFGFCFGGHCVLELARSGAPLKATLTFHGTLDTTDRHGASNITGSVLVLDGAEDPLVPREQLPAFAAEMSAASVDWQLLSFGGAVHSFTDPQANVAGISMYHDQASKRAFRAMYNLLSEVM
ncbi:dienelactone hydrolase [Erwinia toletana]|uniref:Dienelactone hydrolase n=1 Tax=Winslowiella toletana TaxID=92490 RepID=A0ABS4PEJ2_9GAMM|nr:dienelactone hydrolase family protein [Winslowiella toletana]MBP2171042.1 dienelactone hydrolase [Winslowiella toletana]